MAPLKIVSKGVHAPISQTVCYYNCYESRHETIRPISQTVCYCNCYESRDETIRPISQTVCYYNCYELRPETVRPISQTVCYCNCYESRDETIRPSCSIGCTQLDSNLDVFKSFYKKMGYTKVVLSEKVRKLNNGILRPNEGR